MSDETNKRPEPDRASSSLALLLVLFFRELIVDFLAILIPGFWFIAASIPAFVLPMFWFIALYDGGSRQDFMEKFGKLLLAISAVHTEFFISVVVVSYLIGHLMFRQDPRRPDQLSWIMVHSRTASPNKLSHMFRWILRTVGRDTKFPIREDKRLRSEFNGMARPIERHVYLSQVPVDFPYSHLTEYLNERGFNELANLVPWNYGDPKTENLRSKHFVNNMKAVLEFKYPEKIRELTRIESHIRLHSSLWYACFYLGYLSIIGVVLGLLSNLMLWRNSNSFAIVMVLLPALVYVVSFIVQGLIEKAFHYQRTREVFYVLRFMQLTKEQSRALWRP